MIINVMIIGKMDLKEVEDIKMIKSTEIKKIIKNVSRQRILIEQLSDVIDNAKLIKSNGTWYKLLKLDDESIKKIEERIKDNNDNNK